jgi:hypothetical protein
MLLAGAAALAVGSAAAAAPQQGKGKGNNKGSAKAERSHKQAKAGNFKHGNIRVARAPGGHGAKMRFKQDNRGMAKVKARGDDRKLVRLERDHHKANRVKIDRDDRRVVRVDRDWNDNVRRGVWADNGCPPGLAKKAIPCVPPGQLKSLQGQSLSAVRQKIALQELPLRLRSLYRDDDDYYYRYGNGYVYKVDRDRDVISSLLPLFGLGAMVGQPFPAGYSNSYLPASLQSFYPDTPYTSYKYANGYVYQVDPVTGLIEDVDPMLGYGHGYGQMMPASYSAYNLPYQYRSFYQDNDDYYYRYAPGSIYRVDAGSGLIDSIAALLMPSALSVGQPLPMGYDAYNVPMQYRSQYYDTPQTMYRYANGNIYQVDPTTHLVTAIISALI